MKKHLLLVLFFSCSTNVLHAGLYSAIDGETESLTATEPYDYEDDDIPPPPPFRRVSGHVGIRDMLEEDSLTFEVGTYVKEDSLTFEVGTYVKAEAPLGKYGTIVLPWGEKDEGIWRIQHDDKTIGIYKEEYLTIIRRRR